MILYKFKVYSKFWKLAVSSISTCQTTLFLISFYFVNRRIRQIHDHNLTSLGSAVILLLSSSCKLIIWDVHMPVTLDITLCLGPLAVIKTKGRVLPKTDQPRLSSFALNFNKGCLVEIWHIRVFDISDTKSVASKCFNYYYSPYGTQFHILQVLFFSFSMKCPLLATALHAVT